MESEATNDYDFYTLRLFYEGLYLPSSEFPSEKDCQNISPDDKFDFLNDHLEGIYSTQSGKILQRILASKSDHREIVLPVKPVKRTGRGIFRRSSMANKENEKRDKKRTPWFIEPRLDMVYIVFYNPRIGFYNQEREFDMSKLDLRSNQFQQGKSNL